MDFDNKYKFFLEKVNLALKDVIKVNNTPEKTIYDAMNYSLMAGGKRIRPVLTLAVCDMLGGELEKVIPFACAIEMIHTYSLIHDDLPAMDNDDYRRGRLTNHKVYGDGMAVLAGDALLNYAFETMLNDTLNEKNNIMNKLKAMQFIANKAGVSGMIGGQVADLEAEGKAINNDVMNFIHKCKTGALLNASVIPSAMICGADDRQIEALTVYAEKIGLAFQIKDDILDIEGSLETMGKSTGSDEANNKSTYVTVYGIEKAKEILINTTKEAVEALDMFGERAYFLKNIAEYITNRNN